MIEINNLSKNFGNLEVIRNMNFKLSNNEIVCILGPSGCGKSTLLNIISGLDSDFKGSFHSLNKKTSYVFQEDRLLNWKTVYENISFVNENSKKVEIMDIIEKIELKGFENKYPQELSGGMRQRCSIARAFNFDSPLLLMDEPFKSLDYTLSLKMIKNLINLWEKKKNTILIITHDIDEALLLGNRVLIFSQRPSYLLEEIIISQNQKDRKLNDIYLVEARNKIIDLLI